MSTHSCYIIAEAGVNHNGDVQLAHDLIAAAAKAGADAVKFQTFRADAMVTEDTAKANYQKEHTDTTESQHAMLNRLELSEQDHHALIATCKAHGITFLSTGFDTESLTFLHSLDLPVFKISSGELTNLPLLRQVASFGKPIIMSTGMATIDEISASMHALEQAGASHESMTLLHCTTQYPTPMEQVNLRAMLTLAEAFPGVNVGYSDHTLGIEVPIAAVAMGACVIEKHFTLDRTMEGPDHAASLEPGELEQMVKSIRNIGYAMGTGEKIPSAEEIATSKVARKSIVAARDITQGEVFSEQNLTVKRSNGGCSPMLWDNVLGGTATKDFSKGEAIPSPES